MVKTFFKTWIEYWHDRDWSQSKSQHVEWMKSGRLMTDNYCLKKLKNNRIKTSWSQRVKYPSFRGGPFNSWGGGWVISGQQDFFFLATWRAGNFFPSQTVCKIFFFSPHFSTRFFFPQKSVVFTFTGCGYIYIVVIAVIVLIWAAKIGWCFLSMGCQ